MNIITFDKETGRVLSMLSGSSALPQHYETPTTGALYMADVVDPSRFPYIDGEGLAHAPPPPTPSHTWDWPSKAWVLSLAAAKGAKWAEVKAARDAQEFGVFKWNGLSFDGDVQAQRRLNLAVMAAQAALSAGEPWSMDWTLFDNTTIALSAADMIGVVEALGANINAAHEAARAKRALIEAATTVQQLDAI